MILSFTYGYDRLRIGAASSALPGILAGVTAGALLIRYTEKFINGSKTESWIETLTNILFFSLAIGLFMLYFSRIPAKLPLDLLSGLVVGTAASLFQAAAAKEKISGRHTLSLAVAFGAAVLLIRNFALAIPPAAGMLIINLPVTTIIVIIEYRNGSNPEWQQAHLQSGDPTEH